MNFFKHHNAGVFNPHTKHPMSENDIVIASAKIFVAWVMAGIAKFSGAVLALTLSQWVQVAALLFTLAQLYFLVRDKWWRERKPRRKSRNTTAAVSGKQTPRISRQQEDRK